jgi:excisionase family DNA binding protein
MRTILEQLDAMTTAITVGAVATLLGISKKTAYQHCLNGRIPSYKLVGSVRIDPAELAAHLRRSTCLGIPKCV